MVPITVLCPLPLLLLRHWHYDAGMRHKIYIEWQRIVNAIFSSLQHVLPHKVWYIGCAVSAGALKAYGDDVCFPAAKSTRY